MVIRITFRDNDFTQVIERFFGDTLFSRYCNYTDYLCKWEQDISKKVDILSEKDRQMNILALMVDNQITKEQQESFVSYFKKVFDYYLFKTHSEDYGYLKRNLKVTVLKTITPKWENGEVVYYIPICEKILTM